MHDQSERRLPAAVPTVAFALGIAAARLLVDPWFTVAGLVACAVLCAILSGRGRLARRCGVPPPPTQAPRDAAPTAAGTAAPRGTPIGRTTTGRDAVAGALFLAAGIAVAAASDARRDADLARIDARGRDRFAAVRIPLDRGWERRGETATIRARTFTLLEDGEEVRVELPIYLTLWDEPPESTAMAASLRAEGFLLCDAAGCRMNAKSARLVEASGALPAWHPAAWNRAAAHRIERLGRESETARRGAAQAAALALGRGELLDEEVREAYRRGGTYHLLVFSGMQIALAAGILSWTFRRVGRPRPADWVLLAIAIVAPPFAGHDPSVSRASVMIGCYAASRLLGRPTPPANLLFVAALFRLAAWPAELTDPGFALTWGATGGLILVGGPLAARFRGALARALAFGLGAELGTAPITALFFHQIVVGSSLVTLLLSPLLSLMVAISAAACALAFVAPRLALLVLEAIGRLDAIAVAANRAIADSTGIARIVAAPPAPLVCASVLAAIAAVLVAPKRGAFVAAALLLVPPLASLGLERSRRSVDEFTMTVIDVGQGEAILLRQGSEAILIDGGGKRGDPTFGRRVLVPWLIDRGVRRPAVALMTHADPDHCGGLVAAVDLLGAGEVWLSSRHLKEPCAGDLFEAARRRRIPVRLVDRDPPRRAGALPVRVYAADPPFRRSAGNNMSVTMAFAVERRRFLLTGDIERAAEFKMLESAPELIACDVLKVPHHGSGSSTGAPFLRMAGPRLAAISCGRGNGYGHPATDLLERLGEAGVRVFRTDLHGTVSITVRNGGLFAKGEIDTSAGSGSLGGRGLSRRTMSSIFIRIGLYGILVVLAVFVAGQAFSLPYSQVLTSAHLGQAGLAGLALIAVGLVLRIGEKVRRKTKKGKGRCVICKRPVLVGDKYCRDHLRQVIGEEQERLRAATPPRR